MANNPPPVNLTCSQCGFVNEAERVFCHNCGSKLDRSVLPPPKAGTVDSPEATRKRIAKVTNPKSVSFLRGFGTFFKVLFFSVLLAALIVLAQKPDAVPELKKTTEMRLVSSDMMEALQSPQPRSISFSEDDVNQYLSKTVKKQDTVVPGVELERVYAAPTPGVLRLGSEYSVFGYPIFTEAFYKLEVKNGKFTPTVIGIYLGRIAVDPRLMPYAGWIFGGPSESLKRERGQMDHMEKVDVAKGEITLVTKGGGR